MNYNKLYCFYRVAQTLNFTRAAEELYVSQPAVSRHIKDLEEDFGAELFIRTNKDLILTEAGETLYNEIRPFFSREQEIYHKVRAAASPEIKQLSIGFMGIKTAYHIPAIVNEMLSASPSLSINLRRYNWDEIEPALIHEEIDVALRLRMGPLENADMENLVLDKDSPAMVVSNRHPTAGKKTASIKDYKNDNLLLLSQTSSGIPHDFTLDLFKRNGVSPKSYSVYSQVETILMLIHADAGVSLLSRFAATDQFPDLKVVNLEGLEPMYLELVWKKAAPSPCILPFVKKMQDYYGTE